MFKSRFISSIIIVILTIAALYFGGIVTAIALCAVCIKGMQELLRVFKLDKTILAWAGYVSSFLYFVVLYFDKEELLFPVLILYLLFLLAVYVFTFPKYKDKDIMISFFSLFYVTVMLSYLYRIRDLENGLVLVILVFVSSWGNDVFAYLVGVLIGKHKMSPKVSPNKSVEGGIGGILGSALCGLLFGYVFKTYVADVRYAMLVFAVIGAIGALPAVIGDLAASAIKRNNEVKDYGHLIPGHGGILDRFDSVIFTAPIVYYMITLFMEYVF